MKISKMRKDSAILAIKNNNLKAAFNALPNDHPVKKGLHHDVNIVVKYLTMSPNEVPEEEEYQYYKAGKLAPEVFAIVKKTLLDLETF